ncbi:hypothetical protein Adt_06886 [Abeliophyllum distichum]|uniref:Protein BIC1 n=1 Tax=Abeliophyllum distichum TaxID=126358 RepID=A0ABD1V867_9LAMI
MTHQNSNEFSESEFKIIHQPAAGNNIPIESESSLLENQDQTCLKQSNENEASSTVDNPCTKIEEEEEEEEEKSGRERLKRHRVEIAGRVWIPDTWGQENLLKDWTDCSAFDASLVNKNIMSARASLVEQGRRANSSSTTSFRIQNS